MRLTDSHCHLAMPDAGDATMALERARAAGVVGVVVPGTQLDDAPAAVAVAQLHADVWAAVGFHPHEAKDCSDEPKINASDRDASTSSPIETPPVSATMVPAQRRVPAAVCGISATVFVPGLSASFNT